MRRAARIRMGRLMVSLNGGCGMFPDVSIDL
jgi:hypothetical protein